MKVTINIECTPEEARTFFGLPDLKPMQDAVMAKVEKQMLDAVGAFAPEAMLRTWMGGMAGGSDAMQTMFANFFRPGSGASAAAQSPPTATPPGPPSGKDL